MIKSITITNHLGDSIRLELTNPWSSGFVIRSIEGLGPVNANVNFTELATIDGAIDNSARLESRNIILSLLFLEKPTIEATRLLSYKYFPVKRNIKFLIETDSRVCEIIGRVESNEPNIFDKQEGCQVSILCPDPYFYSFTTQKTVFNGVEPLFEFPFENNSLTDNLIEFGNIYTKRDANVYYEGDEEVGITIKMHAMGEIKGFKIYKLDSREIMELDDEKLFVIIGSYIQKGDDIIITTTRGNKSIKLLRQGISYNILNSFLQPINWFQLKRGDNVFAYTAEEGILNVVFDISNKMLYEGV